ncbi:hypothetical protein Fcan01_17978 [Folsomia candida]|uniref:Uncharacterized protein n=1 Tax=Folsomia candida TaxID=158441 RepID=A0A226DQJ4_FOLCA|nr:hypothetical protein Fcan01_17978 [Folsomia candida]
MKIFRQLFMINVKIKRLKFQIGYLRDGRMLVQDSPNALLEKYGPEFFIQLIFDIFCAVFVYLESEEVQLLKVGVVNGNILNAEPIRAIPQSKISDLYEHSKNYYSQLKALTIRNLIVFTRYPL